MRMSRSKRLLVAYVPSLDLRRITYRQTPYIHRLLAEHPTVRLRGLPDTELLATILTGAWPHEHGGWQLRLRSDAADGGSPRRWERLAAALPDALATTVQGIAHLLTGEVDLATMPPARRRQFELLRFKYERRASEWEEPSSARPSLFARLGSEMSRYYFTKRFDGLEEWVERLPSEGRRLELLEMYALDLFLHWNLDRPEAAEARHREVDDFVRALHARAEARGVGFALLSDHGQEPVRGTIDLLARLQELDVPAEEYVHYLQVPSARFWFRTERARRAIRELLEATPGVRALDYREMAAHGVRFETPEHGELYGYAEPGLVFFPHDFHQPLASLFLGLSDRLQRPRIRNPVHRGCHGYLTGFPSEEGFLTVADPRMVACAERGELVDVAPSLLALLGEPVPEAMSGRPLFARRPAT